jgi:exodeoxyribonuclease VII small subunit
MSDKKNTLTDKLKKLQQISKYFEQEEIDIDESLKKYEEGVKLAAEIKEQLHSYELKIKEIRANYEDSITDSE